MERVYNPFGTRAETLENIQLLNCGGTDSDEVDYDFYEPTLNPTSNPISRPTHRLKFEPSDNSTLDLHHDQQLDQHLRPSLESTPMPMNDTINDPTSNPSPARASTPTPRPTPMPSDFPTKFESCGEIDFSFRLTIIVPTGCGLTDDECLALREFVAHSIDPNLISGTRDLVLDQANSLTCNSDSEGDVLIMMEYLAIF